MNTDLLTVALVASIAPTITAGGALFVIIRNDMRASQDRAASRKILLDQNAKMDFNALKVDGRLTELLESEKRKARAEGVVAGTASETAAQAERDAASLAKIEEARAEIPPDVAILQQASGKPPVIELTAATPSVIVKKK